MQHNVESEGQLPATAAVLATSSGPQACHLLSLATQRRGSAVVPKPHVDCPPDQLMSESLDDDEGGLRTPIRALLMASGLFALLFLLLGRHESCPFMERLADA